MEGRSIEQMIATSKAVKGGMDNYLTTLEAKTRENIRVLDDIRKSNMQTKKGTAVSGMIKEK